MKSSLNNLLSSSVLFRDVFLDTRRFEPSIILIPSTMHLLFSLLIFTSIGAGNRCLDVNIAVPGTFEFGDSTSSLSFIGPAVDTGIAALRANYPQFNWTATYVWDQNIHGCPALFDNVQNMLARWYYRERQEVREGIDAIITSGSSIVSQALFMCTRNLIIHEFSFLFSAIR